MTGSIRFWYTSDTAAHAEALMDPITTALVALTNAHLQTSRGASNPTPSFGYGSDAAYAPIEDKAALTFNTARLGRHTVQVPAPLAAIFLADEQTVDPANTLVAAFVSAFTATVSTAFVSTADGAAIIGYVGGVRRRSKLRRKMTIFTLNPAETGPGE
jgi:hypothetical protein